MARTAILAFVERLRLPWWVTHDRALPALILILGSSISLTGFLATHYHYQKVERQAFEIPAAHYSAVIGKAIDRYAEAINQIGAYFEASKDVERWEFQKFTEDYLPRFPAIQSLQWVPRVSAADRRKYEKLALADGLYGFRIVEQDEFANIVKAGKREEYLPVYFVEPFKGNESSLGLDLSTNPLLQQSLERARDSGEKIATAGTLLSAGNEIRNGITIIQPVFATGAAPDTLEARRENLVGFALATIRVVEMLNSVLENSTTPVGLDVYIFDASVKSADNLLFYRPSRIRPGGSKPLDETSGLFSTSLLRVADRQWNIVLRAAPGTFAGDTGFIAWGVLAFGMLLTALLANYVVSSATRTRLIERSVALRTAELSESNAALETEISQRRQVEVEMRTAKEEAEVANQAKSDFLAMVSHELRTPLNAIIGFSEVMANEMQGPLREGNYLEYSKDIHDSGTHLLSLINDILDLSKIEANELQLNETPLDVPEIVHVAVGLVQADAAAGRVTIKTVFPGELPRLRADERALKQTLINLLSNAIKFTEPGGRVQIECGIGDAGCFELTVTDTGIGIDKKYLHTVFQPFSQIDSSLARKYEGTGLGLPLCKRLMELHGASVNLESTPGRGTTVHIVFPEDRVIDGIATALLS